MAVVNDYFNQLKIIVPNLSGELAKYKLRRGITIALIPICFAGFGLGGALCGITGNMGFIALALSAFFGLPASVFLTVFNSTKISSIRYYLGLVDTINREDKLFIRRLNPNPAQDDLLLVNTVKRLIETGNLPSYRVVADIMIVKDGIYITEEEAVEEYKKYMALNFPYANYAQPAPAAPSPYSPEKTSVGYCQSCGKAVPGDAEYCPYCGSRLYK